MCCITTIFLEFGSRIAILVWWLVDPQRFVLAFKNWALPINFAIPLWVWPLLGAIFLPWTTLAYLFVFPGGVMGYKWIVLGIALLIDLAGYSGGYRHRNRLPI
ncbi:MAG: hypothetical protein ABSG98_09380 [Anaerolineales bacterium]|jgi:hypothetical protein